jgi:hypothetical protein
MNTTTSDVLSGLEMPSGCEVESATFHAPLGENHIHSFTPEPTGIRGKLNQWKSRSLSTVQDLRTSGLAKVHDVQHVLADRGALVRGNVQRSMSTTRSSMRDGVNGKVSQMQSSMQSSPMKWAGIAAGSGLAIGLVGRFVHWRNQRLQSGPQLVIIESTC